MGIVHKFIEPAIHSVITSKYIISSNKIYLSKQKIAGIEEV